MIWNANHAYLSYFPKPSVAGDENSGSDTGLLPDGTPSLI